MFRQMLMSGASRAVFSPGTDEGSDDDALPDVAEDALDDALDDDEDDGDEAGGAVDKGESDDDEPEGQSAGDQDRQVDQPTRGGNRIAALAERTRLAEERAAAVERELAGLRQREQQQSQHQTQQQREARLAEMSESERLEFLLAESNQRTQLQLNEIRFNSWDQSDKAEFQALRATKPALASVTDAEIEQALATMRANGTNAPRSSVATFLIGQKAIDRVPKAKAAGQRAAAAGRERQTVRPTSGRGDVTAGSGRRVSEAAARRARLEDVEI